MTAPLPDLAPQRQELAARLAAATTIGARPAVRARTPLHRLTAATEGKYANLLRVGLGGKIDEAEGRGSSEALTTWAPVVVGVAVIVAGVVTDHLYLIVIGAVFVLLSAVRRAAVAKVIRSNPNNLSPADVRTIIAARRWRSSNAWERTRAQPQYFALVETAAGAAQRIADTEAWREDTYDDIRARLDLRAALISIDDAAYATARHRQDRPDDALTDRVAALLACADALDALDGHDASTTLRALTPVVMGTATTGN